VRLTDFDTAEMLTEENRTSVTLPVPAQEVWVALPEVFGQLEIPIPRSDPQAMAVGNPDLEVRRIEGKRMSQYVDCGMTRSGIVANLYDVTLTVNSRVSEGPDGAVVLTTTLDAWARPRTTNGNPVHCTSTGTLESRIGQLVAERLGVGGGGDDG
jgi:hypothetical protein